MILGLLSDSHGRETRTAAAVALLRRLGAEALVHCGDVGSEDVLAELAGVRAWFVWGNTDPRDARLDRFAAELGLAPPGAVPLRLDLAGRRIAVCHGHEPAFAALLASVERAAEGGDKPPVDYLLHGHTHVAADVRCGAVRIINPGALHRAAVYTVATLDLARDALAFWRVVDGAGPADEPIAFTPSAD